MRESVPLCVLLRNRLHYALSTADARKICKDKEGLIKVDNKVRREPRYPAGFSDVISIDKTGRHYRMLYDVKGKFAVHEIESREATFKLCKVKRKALGANKIPYIVTHDGRTLRYPHPSINIGDTIKYNLETGDVDGVARLDNGNTIMAVGGNNIGRVGVLSHVEKHPGSFDIAHVRDSKGNSFATRVGNIFVLGEGKKSWISLPKGNGIKLTPIQERDAKARN